MPKASQSLAGYNLRYPASWLPINMVIDPLVEFGILQAEFEPHKTLGREFRELSTIRFTPFGKGLLEAMHDAMKKEQP